MRRSLSFRKAKAFLADKLLSRNRIWLTIFLSTKISRFFAVKQQIQKIIDKAITLKELQREIITLFAQTKQERKTDRIGYAAGIISSDGPDHIEENIKKLENYTEQLRKTYNFPIFSATDIFSDQTFKGISDLAVSPEEKQKKFIKFWQQIFHSGHITDIFMTPRWQLSEGALDEYTMAKKLGLKIHYIK